MTTPSKYPWDQMLDGRRWEFPITDLDVSIESFRYTARQAAKRRGWKGVSVRLVGRDNNYVQIMAHGPIPTQYQDVDVEPTQDSHREAVDVAVGE